jgi:hypothetical protein
MMCACIDLALQHLQHMVSIYWSVHMHPLVIIYNVSIHLSVPQIILTIYHTHMSTNIIIFLKRVDPTGTRVRSYPGDPRVIQSHRSLHILEGVY